MIGLAVSVSGLMVGWLLRRRASRLAEILHYGSAVLVRVLAALALGWGAARALDKDDALHIGAAVLFCLIALSLLLTAIPLAYIAIKGRGQPRT